MGKATLFCIIDVSGSMGVTKKMLSKNYYHMFEGMLKGRYGSVNTRFITHTTSAKEVLDEDDVWYKGQSGGTYLSSGVTKALEIINSEIDTNTTDVFTLIFSDGDNWGEDNIEMIEKTTELCGLCSKVEFLEVKISTYTSTIKDKLDSEVNDTVFKSFQIHDRNDIKELLPAMFSQEFDANKKESLKAKDQNRISSYENIIKITRDGNNTIVELKDGTIGIAVRHPEDAYNDEIGFNVARLRAEMESIQKQLGDIFK